MSQMEKSGTPEDVEETDRKYTACILDDGKEGQILKEEDEEEEEYKQKENNDAKCSNKAHNAQPPKQQKKNKEANNRGEGISGGETSTFRS